MKTRAFMVIHTGGDMPQVNNWAVIFFDNIDVRATLEGELGRIPEDDESPETIINGLSNAMMGDWRTIRGRGRSEKGWHLAPRMEESRNSNRQFFYFPQGIERCPLFTGHHHLIELPSGQINRITRPPSQTTPMLVTGRRPKQSFTLTVAAGEATWVICTEREFC